MLNTIHLSDALVGLRTLPDASINCCVTSPPYYGLRDYGVAGQIGLEETPDAFIAQLVAVFREVRRVLRDDGTLWVNIGDSYTPANRGEKAQPRTKTAKVPSVQDANMHADLPVKRATFQYFKINGIKQKDLIGIPWMLAFALRADGWYLRQDIIWHKPNPMPESVADRCTKAHEYIFLLSKSAKYFYDADAIKTPGKNPQDDLRRLSASKTGDKSNPDSLKNGLRPRGAVRPHDGFNGKWDSMTKAEQQALGANKRSVWSVATKPFKEAHFATFPEDLITDCIKAGCPDFGIVLDPFMGAGTTAVVADKLGRFYTGFELNPEYKAIAEARILKART